MVCRIEVITMDMEVFSLFKHFGLAILLVALMGLERERKETRLAGLRTFILVTLFGTLCGQIAAFPAGQWIVFAGMVAIGDELVGDKQSQILDFSRPSVALSSLASKSMRLERPRSVRARRRRGHG